MAGSPAYLRYFACLTPYAIARRLLLYFWLLRKFPFVASRPFLSFYFSISSGAHHTILAG